ncbi:UNVERIFIED_CONTAM: hypothetical protein PYX00_007017 [Menopon gallinae]|uniref:LRRNT domain-containing protein n=1 Tax=Menopon gallinae TaxID=328185 RepID=A0AAW2HHX1_9NEOP
MAAFWKYLFLVLPGILDRCEGSLVGGSIGHPVIGAIGGHPIITPQSSELTKCPWACSCSGLTVDCSHRGLTQVPRNLPTNAEKL